MRFLFRQIVSKEIQSRRIVHSWTTIDHYRFWHSCRCNKCPDFPQTPLSWSCPLGYPTYDLCSQVSGFIATSLWQVSQMSHKDGWHFESCLRGSLTSPRKNGWCSKALTKVVSGKEIFIFSDHSLPGSDKVKIRGKLSLRQFYSKNWKMSPLFIFGQFTVKI